VAIGLTNFSGVLSPSAAELLITSKRSRCPFVVLGEWCYPWDIDELECHLESALILVAAEPLNTRRWPRCWFANVLFTNWQ